MLLFAIDFTSKEVQFYALIAGAAILVLLAIVIFCLTRKKKKVSQQLANVDNGTKQETVSMENSKVEEAAEVEEPIEDNKTLEAVERTEDEETPEVEEPIEDEETPEVEEVLEVEETPVVKEAAPKKKAAPAKENEVKETVNIQEEADDDASTKKKRQYAGKYEVFKDEQYFRYQLKASNGELLFVSEMYTTRDGAIKSIEAVRRNVETGSIRIIADKRGMYKFCLIAKNHRLLVNGSNYSTEKAAISASESFKRFAVSAPVSDIVLTKDDVVDTSSQKIEVSTNTNKKGAKFEITKDSENGFTWYLKASNGEILCSQEGYTTKNGVLNGIESFRTNVFEGTFYVAKDKRGSFEFKLYTKNGRICAVGESYPTKTSAVSAANSVVSFAKNAEIVE